ncbi:MULTISPECIES: hypothetical protein [unclassified Burkholderia]|uniref:hypothetical protein n=1 Tax=unclassified Burkholderia TaxID=2613784 RepID=UPI0012E39D27|nr:MULTISPECIES: hypothetical protein [unclassified Burkholderia]
MAKSSNDALHARIGDAGRGARIKRRHGAMQTKFTIALFNDLFFVRIKSLHDEVHIACFVIDDAESYRVAGWIN